MLRRFVPVIAAGALVTGALVAPGAAALPGQVGAAVASLSADDAASPDLRARLAVAPEVDTRAEDPDVTFLVGLPRDSAALQAAAQERSTPGNLLYRDHPSLVNAGKAYGAKTTPHMFVIDRSGNLAYIGAPTCDDGKDLYVVQAVTAIKEGKAPSPSVTKNKGCGVKYAKK